MLNSSEKYLRLFSNCLPVKGSQRSLICDLQKGKYEFIPNDLYDILSGPPRKVKDIFEAYGEENKAVLEDYILFIINREFGFFCNEEELELFPPLSLKWDYPALITNALIDVDHTSDFDIPNLLKQLEDTGCSHIQFRIYNARPLSFFTDILKSCDKSIFNALNFILRYSRDISHEEYMSLLDFPRVQSLIVFSYPEDKIIRSDFPWQQRDLIYIKDEITVHNCGVVHPDYFSVNIKLFSEAQKHNTCLNRKIGIDTSGNIKNCPSMKRSYGNLRADNIRSVAEKSDFQSSWFIHKDQVNVCSDCEFRYICTDCRAYLTDAQSNYSKPQKCGYDPYTTKWESGSKNSLKEKTIV